MTDSPWPAPTAASRAREFVSKRRQTISGIALVVTIIAIVVVDVFVWDIPGL